eukprot:s3663_g1.t1
MDDDTAPIPPRDDLSDLPEEFFDGDEPEAPLPPPAFEPPRLTLDEATANDSLEVPVSVNQDEKELLLMKTLENPYRWYETEFSREEEVEGMKKEMKSMKTFDVFREVHYKEVPRELLDKVISTRWVKVRKSDGTVRCRLVVRGYTQQVEDKGETFASTPSLTTLKLLLTLAVAKG